jgi:hypothetical protein
MKIKMFKSTGFIFLVFLFGLTVASAQQKEIPSGNNSQDSARLKLELIGLRDDFIGKIKAMGYTPGLKPPEILLDNPRSFGNYNIDSNVLHTGYWPTLQPGLKAMFNAIVSRIGNGMTGEVYFNLSVHQWVFIHELGHWWRACQHQTALPYANELAANRIDVAYWREKDSSYAHFAQSRFEDNLKIIPNPVPAGQDKETYLNENYEKLPGGPAYSWYQSTMVVDAFKEKPEPTFKQEIERAGNPAK